MRRSMVVLLCLQAALVLGNPLNQLMQDVMDLSKTLLHATSLEEEAETIAPVNPNAILKSDVNSYCTPEQILSGYVGYHDQKAQKCGCLCNDDKCRECPEGSVVEGSECVKYECDKEFIRVPGTETCTASGLPAQQLGRYLSVCPEGFTLDSTKTKCQTEDECCLAQVDRLKGEYPSRKVEKQCTIYIQKLDCETAKEDGETVKPSILKRIVGAEEGSQVDLTTAITEVTFAVHPENYCAFELVEESRSPKRTVVPKSKEKDMTASLIPKTCFVPSDDFLKALSCGPLLEDEKHKSDSATNKALNDKKRREFVARTRDITAKQCPANINLKPGLVFKTALCESCIPKCVAMLTRAEECHYQYYKSTPAGNPKYKDQCNYDSPFSAANNHWKVAEKAISNPSTFALVRVPSSVGRDILGEWVKFSALQSTMSCRSEFDGILQKRGNVAKQTSLTAASCYELCRAHASSVKAVSTHGQARAVARGGSGR